MNVGLAVFTPEAVRLFIEPDINRLAALDANLRALPWQDIVENAEDKINELKNDSDRRVFLRMLIAPILVDENSGQIVTDETTTLANTVVSLMEKLVRRPRIIERLPKRTTENRSKLNAELRSWFRSSKILSSHVDDISRNKVVHGYPIAATKDIYAEFALKNGAIHVIETLDLRGHDKVTLPVQKETAIKSIVLDQAGKSLDKDSIKIAVISASDYRVMRPMINMVTGYADDVITMESTMDKQRLSDFISTALHTASLLPI